MMLVVLVIKPGFSLSLGRKTMLKEIYKKFFFIIGGLIIGGLILDISTVITIKNIPLWGVYSFGIVMLIILAFLIINSGIVMIHRIEEMILKVPIANVFFGSFGLSLGLIMAYLFASPFKAINIGLFGTIFPILLTILFGYLGFQVGFQKRNDFINLLYNSRNIITKYTNTTALVRKKESPKKILDTSAILDGRLEDICRSGFLEGTLVVPLFVLEEVQQVADSSVITKRSRGRKSLDALNTLKREAIIKIEVFEEFDKGHNQGESLIQIAKSLNGIVVTSDSQMKYKSELYKVRALDISDLTKALKPRVIPGNKINVQVVKEGKEDDQAIAYLEDGTMIVVEKGRKFIGEYLEILITKVLQTSAGKMIFAKPKL